MKELISPKQNRKLSKSFIKKCIILLVFGVSMLSCNQSKKRPNIVFIMSDDHAAAAISAYGNRLVSTPNIDRIASRGIRFTNTFVVSSLCTPSRAAILTGKYSAQNGVRRIGEDLDHSQETFPKLLQDAGYETALFGKWHLGSQPSGFDYYDVIFKQGKFFDPHFYTSDEEWTGNKRGGTVTPGYLTNLITEKAIEWLDKRESDKPFALLVHHKAPHEPYLFPDEYKSLLADKELPLPATFNDDFQGKNSWIANDRVTSSKLKFMIPRTVFTVPLKKPEDVKIGSEEYKRLTYQWVYKGYYRLAASLDDNVGKLLDHLQRTGLDKNTIIVYTSDNGWFLGDHGLRNKMWMYEEALRIPFIISYPGQISENQVDNSFVSALDFAPTFLDYAGAEIPSSMQGRSLKPILDGDKPAHWPTSFFYHYFDQFEVPEHYGLRTEDYKLIKFIDSTRTEYELYDLKADPEELHNVVDDPKYEDIRNLLLKRLEQERKKFES